MSTVHKSYHDNTDPVTDYCTSHTVKLHPLQAELQDHTLKNAEYSRMLGAPEILTIGQSFIKMTQGKKVLDIGTYTGASCLAWALALPEGGKLLSEGQAGTFDFAFIDADKENYSNYYDCCVELLKPGGVILVDNALWSGRVINPAKNDTSSTAIDALNKRIFEDPKTNSFLVNVGDGAHIAIKI